MALADPQVSVIVTFHREGGLADATLRSIERARLVAEHAGISTELVATIDCGDDETRVAVKRHPTLRRKDRVHEVEFGDLSSSRNYAIQRSTGRCVGTFDGDDLFSGNWIECSVAFLSRAGDHCVLHPHMIVAFGEWHAYWYQIDQTDRRFRLASLFSLNHWNACAFAARRVFEACPYERSRVGESGFGFEDWHWNCETIARGFVHRVVPGTLRMERRKGAGSLNVAHQQVAAVLRPSLFFDHL